MILKKLKFFLIALPFFAGCSKEEDMSQRMKDNAYSYATIHHYEQQKIGDRNLIGIKENGAISIFISPGSSIINHANRAPNAAGTKEMHFPKTPAQEAFLYAFLDATHDASYEESVYECDTSVTQLEVTDGEYDYLIHPTCIERKSEQSRDFLQVDTFSTSGIAFFGTQSLRDAELARAQ